jgi:large subunit ribosomal protein L22
MQVSVTQRYIHMAPRKLRLIADTIRGKSVSVALAQLAVMPRAASTPIAHALRALNAAARTKQVNGDVKIATITVDEGPAMKRRILISRGRATRMEHRMSHLHIIGEAIERPVAAKPSKKDKE